MKLRNKKTGEILNYAIIEVINGYVNEREVYEKDDTLAELNEEWEDYEEPKEWYINEHNEPEEVGFGFPIEDIESLREIGLLFGTKEEAEKAVEKLKAWKRLKDKGFKVDLWDYDGGNYQERIKTGRILFKVKDYEENDKDLELLFGGEE